jgi:hypothetical protein
MIVANCCHRDIARLYPINAGFKYSLLKGSWFRPNSPKNVNGYVHEHVHVNDHVDGFSKFNKKAVKRTPENVKLLYLPSKAGLAPFGLIVGRLM